MAPRSLLQLCPSSTRIACAVAWRLGLVGAVGLLGCGDTGSIDGVETYAEPTAVVASAGPSDGPRARVSVVGAAPVSGPDAAARPVEAVRMPGWAPTTDDVHVVPGADLLVRTRLVSTGRRGGGFARRVYDVEIENVGADRAPACVRARSRSGPPEPPIGRGWLAPGARVTFERALVRFAHPGRGRPAHPLRFAAVEPDECPRTPNFVIILADDLGYADVSSFGGLEPGTPEIDRLGDEGIRFTSFYAAPTCTPARAELMTGSYAQRVSMPEFYGPFDRSGLHPDEITLAELVAPRGYRSALVGKWHLGAQQPFRPLAQGFDEFFGIPYSNDLSRASNPFYPRLPVYEGDAVIEREPDQSQLTRRFTERAVSFIEQSADGPFLLVLAHAMPHVPISASEAFVGRSGLGLYADVLLEVDWSVGEVMRALEDRGLADDTLVLFASDNGPWLRFGNHAGIAEPLREGKSTAFEGGVRVPALLRWPAGVPPGRVTDRIAGLIDVWPTLAELIDVPRPDDRILDGRSLVGLIEGSRRQSAARRSHVFHRNGMLHAVRRDRYKLHWPHPYPRVVEPGVDGSAGVIETASTDLALYHLVRDPGESQDLHESRSHLVERMLEQGDSIRLDLGDAAIGLEGRGVRPEGTLDP